MELNPTVFIIDDNEEVSRSLKMLMQSVGYQTRTYHSARQFLHEIDHNQAGCLILDVRMPDISGLQLQEQMHELGIHLPIIFTTAHADVPMAVRAMKLGAVDFLTKPVNSQVLLDIVNKALRIDEKHRAKTQQQQHVQSLIDKLTPREKAVMNHVIAGDPTKVIAIKLGISPKTVDLHRAKVMEKMAIKSIAELVSTTAILDDEELLS